MVVYTAMNKQGEDSARADHAAVRDREMAERFFDAKNRVLKEFHSVIFGQDEAVEQILIALFAGGHCLLEGVPGLAKTLMVSTLSRLLKLHFSRIQFTPDLMPADITGSEVLEENPATRARSFRFIQGPLFANMILADEINRTPPKTQSALLQAMQEGQVTVSGNTFPLPRPFFVMATQNPIEQEGTYPLPEAQLDRFLMKIDIGYPTLAEELRIAAETTVPRQAQPPGLIDDKDVMAFRELVLRVPSADWTVNYAVRLARRSRPAEPEAPQEVAKHVAWGAGPRASQALIMAAKARALLSGRAAASIDDVRAVAAPVLRHRIILNFEGQAEGLTTAAVIETLLKT